VAGKPKKDIKRADSEVLLNWFEEVVREQATGKLNAVRPYYSCDEMRKEILRRLLDYSVYKENELKGEY